MIPSNPIRKINTLNTGSIIRQQSNKANDITKKQMIMDLLKHKIHVDPANNEKWNEIKNEIIFTPDITDQRLSLLYSQLQPDIEKSHEKIVKGYMKEFDNLTKQYKDNLAKRKEYRDSNSTGRIAEIDLDRSKILDKMVGNLLKQKSVILLAIEVENSQKGMVNLKKINDLESNLSEINKKIFSLHTKQSQFETRKDLNPSNEAIKNFDRQNNKVLNQITYFLPTEAQAGHLNDGSFANHIKELNKNSSATNPPLSQKQLTEASKEILKFLDNTAVEEDLHRELDRLVNMLGSKSPSANIKIVNNIEKIKIRLGILDSLRDLREIIESGKLDADGAKIIGYMLVATTNYKVHDSAFITRTLTVFTEYMKSNPVKTVSGSVVLYLFAIFLAQLFVLNSLEEIKDTKDNALQIDLSIEVCEIWLQAAKEIGVDLSSTNYDKQMEGYRNSSNKISNALSELKKIEDAGDIKKQKKISEKQFNKLTPEEKELLYNQDSALNKLDTGYIERKTLEKVPVNDSIITQAIYKTLRDGLVPIIGNKMPEFLNGVKEAAVICNTIRHHVTVADTEIESIRPGLDAMRDDLISRIGAHIDKKIIEDKSLTFVSRFAGYSEDIQKLKEIRKEAIDQVEIKTKECEAKLYRTQEIEVVSNPQSPTRLKPVESSVKEMEKISQQQMKNLREQISESNPNYE